MTTRECWVYEDGKRVEILDWSHMTHEKAKEMLKTETPRNANISWRKGVRRFSMLVSDNNF